MCEKKLFEQSGYIEFDATYACSSAAGGLKMAAAGLVPELTAEAAKQASLGAGAKVMKTYAYQLTAGDAREIEAMRPDIFLLTGGTDGGNREVITQNAKTLAQIDADFPVVIAGNRNASDECAAIIEESGKRTAICRNVMPRLGELDVFDAQAKIREIFLDRIIKAKGLSEVKGLVSGIVMPTPASVLAAMQLLANGTESEAGLGELIAVDVGGATTDVYSMTDGAPERANTVLKGLPEPFAKRTVEGDIGMRYGAAGIIEAAGIEQIAKLAQLDEGRTRELTDLIEAHTDLIPSTEDMKKLDFALAAEAVGIATSRHAGSIEKVYTPVGETYIQTGKDLCRIDKIVMTGGALIHAERIDEIAGHALCNPSEPHKLKPQHAEVFADKRYILSAMGILSRCEPDIALKIMKKELLSYGTAK